MNVTKAFTFQIAKRPAQLLALLPDHVLAEVPIRTLPISILANPVGQVENEGDGKYVKLACERDERLARFGLHVRRVDDC